MYVYIYIYVTYMYRSVSVSFHDRWLKRLTVFLKVNPDHTTWCFFGGACIQHVYHRGMHPVFNLSCVETKTLPPICPPEKLSGFRKSG